MVVQGQSKILKKSIGGGGNINELECIRDGNIEMGRGKAKITRNNVGGGAKNPINSILNELPHIKERGINMDVIGNENMVGRGQASITRKNTGGGTRNQVNFMHNELPHNREGDFDMDAIDSNTHSPIYEENAYDDLMQPSNHPEGENKRKYGSKLASRLQTVLSAHEAADPTHMEGNEVQENPPRKVRTKYLHESRPTIDGTQQNDPNSSQASATSAKRKMGQRGKYRSLALEKKTMGGQFKLDIEIPDFVLQAVGENARSLVNFCGYVVRTNALMDAGDWPDVFAKYGPAVWLQVKNKFNIKDSCTQLLRLQAFTTDAMQRLYRFWKCRLHYYYKECGETYEERLANPPPDFSMANWRACCATFNSDKFKKRSERNSNNRKSDKWCKHTTGNLSFPEVEHILTKQNDGVLPHSDVVWLTEHTRTNGQGLLEWVNDSRSKEIHRQLHQLVEDKDKEPEGDQTRPQTQEEMLLHVLGPKSGYTRGKGSGYGGSAKVRLQQEQQERLRKQQDQITHLQSELEASKKAMEEYKAEQTSIMANMEKRLM